ncbi:DNA polymerase III subunit delta' [Marinovum sp. 2_MG-2023]|uniref:DNA polymerase III subunit delta' n=1 Tax=unclassified Marinovum TaxID=2647166 RepID=UPI0026E2D95A|nr:MULTISPECIES: DNA polymerase III subunit delta' [unclassified Marinovum]MDO6731895.1 DNA polymerase III subunit delta' [Marinovum sp. 2_MG-2023]MDO6781147.1 DNA polymerase III subunit delta' [Marinovum sp. 1_MG-2023]
MSDDVPQPDQIDGAPHPRDTPRLIAQEAAEQAFLTAVGSGRLHHGWMIAGPRGVGKATLAWRIARHLLANPPGADDGGMFGAPPPPDTLDVAADHPVARRIAAGSEPGLFRLVRPWDDKAKRLRAEITIAEVRKLKSRFALSAADGGWRVVIVDAADDMNPNAANALLKLLEEPPARSTLLLVTHQPSALLPTIRSRCRMLNLRPLAPPDMSAAMQQAGVDVTPEEADALAALSAGSVGDAIRLSLNEGPALYGAIISLLDSLPRLDRARALKLAEAATARGAEDRVNTIFSLLDLALIRLARSGATGQMPLPAAAPREAEVFARLAPDARRARAWAEIGQEIAARTRHGRAVNLDPAALILDTMIKLQKTATDMAA